jgi:predicted XRE-type DNA-binding protein
LSQLKYANIFEAISDDPAQAASLKFRADMMLMLREYLRAAKLSQAQIGEQLQVPQPRVSELLGGKIEKFSADKLLGFAARLGIVFHPRLLETSDGALPRISCEVSMAIEPPFAAQILELLKAHGGRLECEDLYTAFGEARAAALLTAVRWLKRRRLATIRGPLSGNQFSVFDGVRSELPC